MEPNVGESMYLTHDTHIIGSILVGTYHSEPDPVLMDIHKAASKPAGQLCLVYHSMQVSMAFNLLELRERGGRGGREGGREGGR